MGQPETAEEIVARLGQPMLELRFLLDRGYRRTHALGVVAEHHQLRVADRNTLERLVFPGSEAAARRARLLPVAALRDARVVVDGYNVVIGVECLLAGRPVFCCDDGLTRDVAGVRGRHRPGDITAAAVDRIASLLADQSVACALFLLDAQVSGSGELARSCREAIRRPGIAGDAETDRHVDRRLRSEAALGAVIASSDRAVVDRAERVVDLVAAVASALGIALVGPPPT